MFLLIWILISVLALWLILYVLWKVKSKGAPRTGVPILVYHQVSDSLDWSITRQRIKQLERGMRFLYEEGYKTVKLDEMSSFEQPGDEKKVALTFDDGYEDLYTDAYPILQKYGFTAHVFIVTGYVGRYNDWDFNWGRNKKKHLDWAQIRELSDAGFGMGSHTVNHPDLTRTPKPSLDYELRASKQFLEDKLGRSVDFLSYPFGRHDRHVEEKAQNAGYKEAYTLCANRKGSLADRFARQRWAVYLIDSPLTLRIKLNPGGLFWIEDMKARIINGFPGWTIALKGSPDYGRLDMAPPAR